MADNLIQRVRPRQKLSTAHTELSMGVDEWLVDAAAPPVQHRHVSRRADARRRRAARRDTSWDKRRNGQKKRW